jgi:hypothetical protein
MYHSHANNTHISDIQSTPPSCPPLTPASLPSPQRGPQRDGYILMSDSNVRSASAVAHSALPLTRLAKMLAGLRCKHKVLIIDGCHVDRPQVRRQRRERELHGLKMPGLDGPFR